MRYQTRENQRGEIAFRRKLVRQQVGGETVLPDELDGSAVVDLLTERMAQTRDDIRRLKDQNIPLTPYLEIGAERGQRALLLENEFGAHGAAADLSFEMLRTCEHYAAVFHHPALPLRVCCDANHLPFLTDSLPFVFAYSMLHHFPDPAPVVSEMHRVLMPGGTMFFAEEPFRKGLYLPLYRRASATPPRSRWVRLLDHFFRIKDQNEEKHGIESNQTISLNDWRRTLSPFAVRDEVLLRAWFRDIQVPLFSPTDRARYLLAYLMGGSISGVCQKVGELPPKASFRPLEQTLACPSCREDGREYPLTSIQEDHSLLCAVCERGYPIVDGVAILLSNRTLHELYPEFAQK